MWLIRDVNTAADTPLPDDVEQLKAALLAERAARREVEARVVDAQAMIAHLKLRIAMFEQDRFGASSERGRKILDQLELQLEELETEIAEAKARAAGESEGEKATVRAFTRAKPVRKPFPDHLPRERVVLPSPTACACCGGKLVKLGETSTETLESIPRTYKVIQTVREKFACRSCESITEPSAPFHPIPRGRAGAHLLADILHGKFCEHQPLNRQSESFARDGLDLSVSTLADWVGACTTALTPLITLIEAHVLAAERIHGDDTTVPVLAKGKTITGRLWTYVRDDVPFGGGQSPAAFFRYSRDRTAAHPARHLAQYAGILQADAYAGYNDLYHPARSPGPITEAACWAELPKVPRAQRVEWQRRAMAGASCSSWPNWARRRWPSRRCGGSTQSSTSSANSTVSRPRPGARGARRECSPWSRSWSNGCAARAASSLGIPTWPRRWTTC